MSIAIIGSAVGSGSAAYDIDVSGLGLQEDDILVVVSEVPVDGRKTLAVTTAGYTKVLDIWISDTYDASLFAFWKRMGATPDTLVSMPASPGYGPYCTIVYALRGVISGADPMDVVPTSWNSANGVTCDPPNITTVTDNCLIMICCGMSIPSTSAISYGVEPAGYTNAVVNPCLTGGAWSACVAVASKVLPNAGAENPGTWAFATTNAFYASNVGTLAFKPAAPTIPDGITLYRSLDQPYVMLIGDPLGAMSEQFYAIANSLGIVACEQLYSMVMEIWLAQHYGDVSIISKSLIQPFSHAKVLNKSLLQEWSHALQLEVMLEQDLSMPESMEIFSEHRYGIVAEVLQAVSEQLYQINANSTLFADLVQPYALAGEAARLYQFDTRLYINGESIPFHTLEWQATDTEYAWSCDFAVKDLAVAQKCVDGAAITITSAGDSWQLTCYGGWFLDKRHASEIYRVSGYSRTKDLDLALPLLGDLPGGMASELVSDLAAPFGISADWQMADGYLAAGKITAGDETPREVIRKIVEDAGGIVQSTPEGNLLIVAEEEIPVPDWPHVVPADTIIARLERISTSEQRDEQRGYNRFLVSDQLASGDGFRWDEVSIDGSTKEVRLFVTPLDPDRLFVLGHSGGSDVSIEPFGIRSLAVKDEQVEFVAGAGKTTKPIYSLTGYSWQKANLGAVSYAEDGLLTAAVSAYSLLKISYQTKYYRWIVRDRNIEDVQFIFHEVTP